MYYHLNNSIYLVSGYSYGCIYDLLHNKLYHVANDVIEIISRIVLNNTLTEGDSSFLSYFLDKKILVEKDKPCKRIPLLTDVYNYPRQIDFAWIEVTNSCNLKCIHCYNEKANIKKTFLRFEEFKYIVDELTSIGINKIQIIGGEPFLLEKNTLFEMMGYLSGKVDSFEIFTNGTLNTKDDLLYIKTHYPNVHIATSLHSNIQKEHERVTQVLGSYELAVTNIKNAKEIELPIRYVGTLIGCINVGKELEFGPPSRRDYIRLSGNAKLQLYNDELLKERVITEKRFEIENLKERVDLVYNENCFSTHLYVGCDMEVYPCPMERRISHGNLKGKHLSELLENIILDFSKDEVEGCKDCEYRYLCIDCRPDSITGNFFEKPWYCTYNPYKGEWVTFEEFKESIKTKQ